jgi:hypothetical protein
LWPKDLKPLAADQVVAHVIANVGARPWDRDEIDQRIIRSFQERKGKLISSQEEVGGYPAYGAVRRTLEVPATNRQEWLDNLASRGPGKGTNEAAGKSIQVPPRGAPDTPPPAPGRQVPGR